jgi:tRNA(Ile)-lysidine synthase
MKGFDYSLLKEIKAVHIGVAFSTGVDSTALALKCIELQNELSFKISLIHINHGLRDIESENEERFAKEFSIKWGVEIKIIRLSPPDKFGDGIEDWARRQRYAKFTEYQKENPGCWICTAHHQDDVLESVMMNLERGCGWQGLIGPRKIRKHQIFRPMLEVSQEEVLKWMSKRSEAWCEDSSNKELNFNRNKWRKRLRENKFSDFHELLVSAKYFREKEEALLKLEKLQLKEASFEYWHKGVEVSLPKGVAWSALELRHLAEMDHRLKTLKSLDVEFLLVKLKAKEVVQINNEAFLSIKNETLIVKWGRIGEFELEELIVNDFESNSQISLRIGPKNYLLEWNLVDKEDKDWCNGSDFCTLIGLEQISFPLEFRPYKSKDLFSHNGLFSKKRILKKAFSELKLSELARRELPMLVSASQVIWVPGYGTNDFCKPTTSTTKFVQLRIICQTTM